MLCRNEALRLPWLLSYYRDLGVDRFLVIDNDSTDETRELLSTMEDVHLFSTGDEFVSHRHGTNWLQALLQVYGHGHWCLTVDADEMLVFPGSEHLNLRDLSHFMDRESTTALFAIMIDMYPTNQRIDHSYEPGQPFLDYADHFDLGPYQVSIRPRYAFPPIKVRGGAQHRLIQRLERRKKGPLLKKLPLLKWSPGMYYGASTHSMVPEVPLSGVTGVLLHFKHLGRTDVSRWENISASGRRSAEEDERISLLSEAFSSTANAVVRDESSVAYRGSGLLADLGFLHCSPEFASYVGSKLGEKTEYPEVAQMRETLQRAASHPCGLAAILREHIL
jgi:glycosyltransferase involved in cell wall biosynthesis